VSQVSRDYTETDMEQLFGVFKNGASKIFLPFVETEQDEAQASLNEKIVAGNLQVLKAEAEKKHQEAEIVKAEADRKRNETESRAKDLRFYEERDEKAKAVRIKTLMTGETRKLVEETKRLERAKIETELDAEYHRKSEDIDYRRDLLKKEKTILEQQDETDRKKERLVKRQRCRALNEEKRKAQHERDLGQALQDADIDRRRQQIENERSMVELIDEEIDAAISIKKHKREKKVDRIMQEKNKRAKLEADLKRFEIQEQQCKLLQSERRRSKMREFQLELEDLEETKRTIQYEMEMAELNLQLQEINNERELRAEYLRTQQLLNSLLAIGDASGEDVIIEI